jgi:hypothetical protein
VITLKLFQFAERNGQLFQALLKQKDLSDYVNDFLFNYLNGPLKKRMEREKNCSIPAEIITHYFVSAFFGILKWWVVRDGQF